MVRVRLGDEPDDADGDGSHAGAAEQPLRGARGAGVRSLREPPGAPAANPQARLTDRPPGRHPTGGAVQNGEL